MEFDKNVCPIVDIQGEAATGKQFDLDIIVPDDGRDVIYGVVRDCHKDPIKDAVVKLIEVDCRTQERKPISHTFTDEYGQFVFGPLCSNRDYEVQIWVNRVKHVKVAGKMDKCDKHFDKECKEEEKHNQENYPCIKHPQNNNCCK